MTFQAMLRKLSSFWEAQGCVIHQGYDLETGAGTFNPTTFLRCLGPEPYQAIYFEPCRRPTDGRYGTNPNRLQHYFQGQVIMKPSPPDILDLCLRSLEAIGFDLSQHDMRFVHDDWESPTLGAWGLGWEVWMDGMEVAQFTYFQSLGGLALRPVTAEITYGLERLALYLQEKDSIFDLQYNDELTYGDIYFNNEVEWSHYNFEKANTTMWFQHFEDYEREAKQMMEAKLPIPAYDFVIKASHAFNLLDARGVISVTERTGYIARIRELSRQIAEAYIARREELGFPLLKKWCEKRAETPIAIEKIAQNLLHFEPNERQDFVLEIGSEELPATFVPIGERNLEKAMRGLLEKEGISYSSLKAEGTPRRLAVYVRDLALGKPATVVEKRGPSLQQAFDQQGDLTPAGDGFFRSIGLTPISLPDVEMGKEKDLTIRAIKGEKYLIALKRTPGKATAEILAEQLPGLILGLDFPKKMRWGNLDVTYARPLRWLLALFGSHVIPFKVGTLVSDRLSWGHRQLANHAFSLEKVHDYFSHLEKHRVMVRSNERKKSINQQLDRFEKELNGMIIERETVMPQVVNLVEWPELLAGSFEESFLKVPKEVLISEMVEHQKYFPVANENGFLKNSFIITANTNATSEIAKGNQKVLSARLSDGAFLYEQGLKAPLESLNEKLKYVTFQKALGTLHDKVERLQSHAEIIQKALKIGSPEKIHRAVQLSKADLASEMVYEFPELQGVIGRYYAEAQGEDAEVAMAIEEQWLPRKEGGALPRTETGTVLSLADKLDNMIGCFIADLKPSSSSDPYALRRQALGMIRMLIQARASMPLQETLEACYALFPMASSQKKEELLKEIKNFIVNRVKTVFLDDGFEKDEIEAALSFGFNDICDAFYKVQALHRFRKEDPKFLLLYEVYKRAKGQLANQKEMTFSSLLLKEAAERNLDNALAESQSSFSQAMMTKEYDKAYQLIAELQPPLSALFEQVKILDDDPGLRANRLALLQRVFSRFLELLDFSKIQISQ